MTGLENVDPNLKRQYESAYGPYCAGDYQIGDTIAAPGVSGKVVWSVQSDRGLVYVVDNSSGFPVEVEASDVLA